MYRVRIVIAVAAFCVIAAGVRAGVTTIDQVGQQFSEKSAKLAPGDTIQFANKDDVTHNINVVNEDDDNTDLGLQKPGQTLTYKFDKAGKFKIRCGIHPNMKMTVSVQ
jgi:cytochrome c peroxidase